MFSVMNDDGTAITIGGTVSSDAEAVFDSLTAADELTVWWATEASTDPRPGGAYHLAWPGPGWDLRGEYLEFDRPTRLRFSWSWDHEADVDAEVTVSLVAEGDRTRITITHTYSNKDERDGYVEGWLHFLPRLAATL